MHSVVATRSCPPTPSTQLTPQHAAIPSLPFLFPSHIWFSALAVWRSVMRNDWIHAGCGRAKPLFHQTFASNPMSLLLFSSFSPSIEFSSSLCLNLSLYRVWIPRGAVLVVYERFQSRPLLYPPLTCSPGVLSLQSISFFLSVFISPSSIFCHPQRLICIFLAGNTSYRRIFVSNRIFTRPSVLYAACVLAQVIEALVHLAARSYCDNPSIPAPASSHAPRVPDISTASFIRSFVRCRLQ